ncbi:MAG TPA: acyl carrier protein [Polyangiaceae bacterium]
MSAARSAVAEDVMDVISVRFESAESARTLDLSTRLVDDLGADSLALVELTLALEEAFDIDIADESIERLRTVADAVEHVEQALV